ncbi:MAG: hypothetical protein PHP93_00055 [Kiritimatiellales bacterium]|nr:hypothetical protein [Kiritimatiellales bacterium]
MKQNETAKREIAIVALLTSPSVGVAAKAAKVSRATIYRWLEDQDFRARLKDRRSAVLESAVESIKTYTSKAVETLADLMDSQDERIRRLASKDMVDYGLRVKEVQSLEDRLAIMEEQLNECARKDPKQSERA